MSSSTNKRKLSTNEKLKLILQGFEEGRTRDELAVEYGYKDYKSLDVAFRRKGYIWRNNRYVQKVEPSRTQLTTVEEVPERVKKILRLVEQFGDDLEIVARGAGYDDPRKMASYLASEGFFWSSEEKKYLPKGEGGSSVESSREEEKKVVTNAAPKVNEGETRVGSGFSKCHFELLDFLLENEEQLKELVSNSHDKGFIPSYLVPGNLFTKSVHMSTLMDDLIKEYSNERNISQRNIIETALIEFFKKYGYRQRVEKLLQRQAG